MNKQTMMNWLSAFSVLAMIACGNNSSNQGPQGASVPQPVPMTTTAMQNQCVRAAGHDGWWDSTPYKIQPYTTPAGGFSPCGCPADTMPTCSSQGLVCVPMALMNGNVAVWSYGNGPSGPGFQPNYGFVNPYQQYRYGRDPRGEAYGRGPGRPERIPARGGQCPPGYNLDRDGDECFLMRRFGPPQGPGFRGGVYAYAFTFTYGVQNSCSIAQLCRVIPGQGPVNGMICQPISPGNPQGIWVQQQ